MMNLPLSFVLPARQVIASGALLVLFCVFAIAGLASFLYGFWLFWRPGMFLAGGGLFLAVGFLGLLGRSGANREEEPF